MHSNTARRITAFISALAICAGTVSCAGDSSSSDPDVPAETTTLNGQSLEYYKNNARTEFNTALDLSEVPFESSDIQAEDIFLEAEEAELVGNAKLSEPMIPGYTGECYVEGINVEGDAVIFTAEIKVSGNYNIIVNSGMMSDGTRSNRLSVNGQSVGDFVTVGGESFMTDTVEQVYLEAGTQKISITPDWGYVWIDNITITPAVSELTADLYNVEKKLSNPNADANAVKLFDFLCDVYGKYTLSGQYDDGGRDGTAIKRILEKTGKKPAILGLDLIEDSPSRVEHSSPSGVAAEKAIEWWYVEGGIVTLAWHWNAPTEYLVNSGDQPWYRGFYKEGTTIDLDKIMNGQDDAGYQLLIDDIDQIAIQLKRLSDAGVPVLWRPLHEAGGNESSEAWFWWGDCEAESYIKLWKLLYDRLTNHHQLNNLIWLWNGQKASFYPGDDTVDIVGWDVYAAAHSYSSQSATFVEATKYSEKNQLICLSENGVMPDPDLLYRDNARWLFFATWADTFVTKFGVAIDTMTEFPMWEKVYQHERILTLDELPDLKAQ